MSYRNTKIQNGVNESTYNVLQLGGVLASNTTIDGNNNEHSLTQENLNLFKANANSIEINANSSFLLKTPNVNAGVAGHVLTLNNNTGLCEWAAPTVPTGTLVSADNGLTENTPGNVRLGGTLLTNTTISMSTLQLDIASTSNTSRLTLNNGTSTLRAATTMQIQTPNVVSNTSRANRVMGLVNASTGQSEFLVLQNRTNMSTYYTQRWINGGATVIPRATGARPTSYYFAGTGSTGGAPSTTITITVTSGDIGVGSNISGTGIPLNTYIVSQSTGSDGLTGDYVLSQVSTVTAGTVLTILGGITGQLNGTSVYSATSQNFVASTNDYNLGVGGPGGVFFTFNNIGTPAAMDMIHEISATVIYIGGAPTDSITLTLLPLLNYTAAVVSPAFGSALGQEVNISGVGYSQGVVCMSGVPTKVSCQRFLKSGGNVGVTMYRNTNGVNDNVSASFTTRDLTYTFYQI